METTNTHISRRNFIKVSGMTSAALTLGISWLNEAQAGDAITALTPETQTIDLNAWISIDTTGKVTITNHRAEMGQGSFQSVPQIIAEELEVSMDQINIVFAQGNGRKYGSQVTGGSSTIRGSYQKLLKLSATAREMLKEAAARKWNVDRRKCKAENGFIIHTGNGQKLSYGELVVEAAKLEVPTDVALKDPKSYTILRKPLPRKDTPDKTNGKAIFGLDKRLPGMLYAVIERSPRFRGKVKSIDDAAALKVPGVKQVLKVNRDVFWKFIKPNGVAMSSSLQLGIEQKYGSVDQFKSKWEEAALARFGSGWVWLLPDLSIVTTANQDNPVMDGGPVPMLGLDVWEHAYYLKYQNRRAEYVKSWWAVVDWAEAEKRRLESLV
jgi:isoquinoline 1-oxidoreductase beta subunit